MKQEFKVGDTVRIIWNNKAIRNASMYTGKASKGDVDTLTAVFLTDYVILSQDRVHEDCSAIPMAAIELVSRAVPTPRPHAEMIHRWADDDSLVVEVELSKGWGEVSNPSWAKNSVYRFKNDERRKLEIEIRELLHKVKQLKIQLKKLE